MSTSREEMERRMMAEAELTRARVAEQGREMGERGRERAEEVKENVASGLHTAAERLRQQSRERGQPGLATRVADPLDRGAQYLQTHSLSQMREDAMRTAQERPLAVAAGVFVTGFLVGRLLRRR